IDGEKYEKLKATGEEKGISFSEIMQIIGKSFSQDQKDIVALYEKKINKYKKILEKTNTGFLVVLENVSTVLKKTIDDKNFFENLQWLLPVDFDQDLYSSPNGELFREFTAEDGEKLPLISFCRISFNDVPV